jgi:hypothetical protein
MASVNANAEGSGCRSLALSGIVIEHPDYEQNEFNIERVVAVRADHFHDNGRIGG